jgi:hypothetical protein
MCHRHTWNKLGTAPDFHQNRKKRLFLAANQPKNGSICLKKAGIFNSNYSVSAAAYRTDK